MKIYCAECEKPCTDKSLSCPHCGHLLQSLGQPMEDPVRLAATKIAEGLRTSTGQFSWTKVLLALGLIIFSVWVVTAAWIKDKREIELYEREQRAYQQRLADVERDRQRQQGR